MFICVFSVRMFSDTFAFVVFSCAYGNAIVNLINTLEYVKELLSSFFSCNRNLEKYAMSANYQVFLFMFPYLIRRTIAYLPT